MADDLDAGSPVGVAPTAPSPSLLKANDQIRNNLEVSSGERIQSNADPSVTFPDTDYDAQARQITEHYQAEQSLKDSTFKAEQFVPPRDPNQALGEKIARNTTNFLFHDELAAIGVDWNRDHVNWSLDNARDFWSEHPIRAGLSMLQYAPVLSGARRINQMIRGTDAGIDAGHLAEAGLIDAPEHFAALDRNAQDIIQGQASQIADVAALRGRIQDGSATPIDKAKAAFNTAFGNSYLDTQAMENMNPQGTLKAWQSRMDDLTTGRAVQGMLELAENVPKSEGTQILHGLKDPSQMKGLSQEGKLFSLAFNPEARQIQSDMLKEGFIDQDTYDKVGPIWFSTIRKGSPITEAGPTTSSYSAVLRQAEDGKPLRVINVPRTSSPNLLERGLDQQGVTQLIKRQRASEALDAGKEDKAMSFLKDSPEEGDQQAMQLIKGGRKDDAQELMGSNGFLESDPKQLVMGHLQQKLLFENYKTLRDVALNPDLTKTYDEVQAMSTATRNRMIPLTRMDGASTLQRMVATKLGKASAPPLGYIHDSLFNSLVDATSRNTVKSGVGLLDIGTAVLKSMKVSANPLAHVHHSVGDMIFLHMAGFNPLHPENMGLLGKSFTAVKDWNVARSSGAAVHEISDLGTLESKVAGMPAIDIAKELQNPLLSGDHGILDTASMESAEGIPMLAKLYSQAGDTQYLAKGLINAAQKTSKVTGLDKASKIYMGENALFKFGYYMHLRQRGLNPLAAVNEVSRRMPMYGTVGDAIARSRRMLMPWLSFPSEATRIIKNNMMDYPFRTAMWMHAPNLVQGATAALTGMDYDEVQARKEQNPMWAQKMQSIVTGLHDKNNDVRTFCLDMLPMSNIYPQSIATNAPTRQKLPMGLGDPAPIITGFIDALQGKDAFGQDIPVDPNSPSAKVLASISATVGLMTPPWIQKYLFNPAQPGLEKQYTPGGYGLPGYRAGQDAGMLKNPSTGKTGDLLYDGVLTNTLVRNYAGSGETEIGNQRFGQREGENYRGRLGREFSAWATSGNWKQASQVLRDVAMSFSSEVGPGNANIAHQNYMDWLSLHAREILKNPELKGLSRQDFIKLVKKNGDSTAPVVSQAQQDYVNALKQGYVQAAPGKRYDGKNPLTRGAGAVNVGINQGNTGGGVSVGVNQ